MAQGTDGAGVFVSYAGTDRAIAAQVATGFREAGADVWWDQNGIGWGDNWLDKLQEALSTCSAYLILVGPSGVSRWVKAELYVALRRHFEADLPIYPVLLPDATVEQLPPFLSLLQARRLPESPSDADFKALVSALQATALEAPETQPVDYTVEPFPGLAAYGKELARFFFGRQHEAWALLERLGAQRWLQVEGPSGVGKSSLVRAALIPFVEHGYLPHGSQGLPAEATVVTLRPGSQPIETLCAALERALAGETESAAAIRARIDEVREGQGAKSGALAYLLKLAIPEGKRLLLVIDQLEELFTLTSDATLRTRLDALLAGALEDIDSPLQLVTTIRSDFLLRFGELPGLQRLINAPGTRYFLGPMGEEGLRDIVQTPVQRVGLRWSEKTLPDRIVADALAAGDAALPLTANLLRLLWQRSRERQDGLLGAEDYEGLGGVGGALATSAGELLDSLGEAGRERARKLLLSLVKPGHESQDTKRPITLAMALEAAGGGHEAQTVLDRLSGQRSLQAPAVLGRSPRLIVISPQDQGAEKLAQFKVDLAHETLLRTDRQGKPYWQTLWDWVNDRREDLEELDFIETMALRWRQGLEAQWPDERRQAAARLFQDLGVAAPEAVRDFLGRVFFLHTLDDLRRLLDEPVTSHSDRAAVGDRLNDLSPTGDPRPGVGLRDGLPDIDWVAIPGGTITLNGVDGSFRVEPFDMARYLVTWTQYRAFIEDPQGYTDSAWWEDLKHKDRPGEQLQRVGNCPADNVSWYDAMAFCRWLTARLRERAWLADDKMIRLPTEWEWQQAATAGNANNTYPWGPERDPGKANTGESGLGRSTAVGLYPAGTWEGGPLDMAGNLWEWCLNKYDTPRKTAPDILDKSRVLRGGSWIFDRGVARAGSRGHGHPDGRGGGDGFRVLCAAPIR